MTEGMTEIRYQPNWEASTSDCVRKDCHDRHICQLGLSGCVSPFTNVIHGPKKPEKPEKQKT